MQTYEKVNWIRRMELANGIVLSVSEKSGLVKIEIPGTGRRAPILYRDEVLALFGQGVEVQRYLDTHDDVISSKEEAKEQQTKLRQAQRAASTAATGLMALGFSKDQIAEILKKQA